MNDYPLYDKVREKWYRQIGDMKEYEPDRLFTAKSSNDLKEPDEKSVRRCPFSKGTALCKQSCALWEQDHCRLSRQNQRDTVGMICPFNQAHRCRSECMLYNNGCSL